MKIAAFLVFNAILLFPCPAFPQAQSLGPKDTFAAARLSATEVRQIIAGVEQLAYDTPDSWSEELRAKRVNLGSSPGLVLQGTKLLCGGTGNCQVFVFRNANNRWYRCSKMSKRLSPRLSNSGLALHGGLKTLLSQPIPALRLASALPISLTGSSIEQSEICGQRMAGD